MGLQNQPQSLRKPPNFPSLDLLSDSNKQRPFDRNAINSMNRSHVDNIYPSFANKNSSQRGVSSSSLLLLLLGLSNGEREGLEFYYSLSYSENSSTILLFNNELYKS